VRGKDGEWCVECKPSPHDNEHQLSCGPEENQTMGILIGASPGNIIMEKAQKTERQRQNIDKVYIKDHRPQVNQNPFYIQS